MQILNKPTSPIKSTEDFTLKAEISTGIPPMSIEWILLDSTDAAFGESWALLDLS